MKTFRLIGMAIVAIVICMNFTACDKDDNDGSNGSGTPSTSIGVVNPENGLLLRQAGELHFYYTNEGKLDYVYNEVHEDGYIFDHSTNQINGFSGDLSNYNRHVYTLAYNKQGYISKVSGGFSYSDEDFYEESHENYSMTYDGEGYMTKIKGTRDFCSEESNYSESSTTTYTINLTWENGMLTKLSQETTGKGVENGSKYEVKLTTTEVFDYENKKYYNQFKQYGATLHWDGLIDMVVNVGMLGYGPDYLPVKRIVTTKEIYKYVYDGEEYEEEESYDSTFDYIYRFNEDGSIKTCEVTNYNDSDYNIYIPYVYGTATDDVDFKEYQSVKTRSINAFHSFGFINHNRR